MGMDNPTEYPGLQLSCQKKLVSVLTCNLFVVLVMCAALNVELELRYHQAIDKARALLVTLVPVCRLHDSEVPAASGAPRN
jgi:hypothetical protein